MSQPTTPPPRGPGLRTVASLLRWTALGSASGILAGLACWAFLVSLDRVTETRTGHPWLVWTLPLIGLAVGWAYHRHAGRAAEGSALLLDEIHQPTDWVPRRMAPMIGIGTLASHLAGASVGREGSAVQLSGSLTDWLARGLGLRSADRRILLTAAIGGGFGAIFGVPATGVVFALEVQRVSWQVGPSPTPVQQMPRRSPWWVPTVARLGGDRHTLANRFAGFRHGAWAERITATVAASFVGDRVVRALGQHHEGHAVGPVDVDLALLGRVAVAGVAFGLVAIAFIEATDLVRAAVRRLVAWPPARPALGGLVVLAGAAALGRSYLGLSLPLVDDALAGHHTGLQVPMLKLAFTAVCLGAGFVGGEVTPLFVIGATLGSALAPTVGLPPVLGAAVGFVAVFGGAANTPVACTVMAVELFGRGMVVPAAVGCLVAYLCSGRRGIYPTQQRRSGDGPVPVGATPSLAERLAARARDRDRDGPPPG